MQDLQKTQSFRVKNNLAGCRGVVVRSWRVNPKSWIARVETSPASFVQASGKTRKLAVSLAANSAVRYF